MDHRPDVTEADVRDLVVTTRDSLPPGFYLDVEEVVRDLMRYKSLGRWPFLPKRPSPSSFINFLLFRGEAPWMKLPVFNGGQR